MVQPPLAPDARGGRPGAAGLSSFRPAGQHDLAPPGAKAKARANLRALDVLDQLRSDGRPATPDEQAVLARWSGWGALPTVFDESDTEWADIRQQLRGRLDERAWSAARRTTLNAHYTPSVLVDQIWKTTQQLGFAGGRVLEPGCGSGNFIGLAPGGLDLQMVGVELDPTTAAVAQALYPKATIRSEGFERTRFPDGYFDLAIGNVPFAKVSLDDPHHNRSRLSMHNHFLVKSLHLTHPGGLVASVTSRFTLDAQNPAARREMAELADFVGAIRLPGRTMQAAAGTQAVTDLVIFRRREPGRPPAGEAFDKVLATAVEDGDLKLNEYFVRHPERILGQLMARHGQYSEMDLQVKAYLDRPLEDLMRSALDDVVAEAQAKGLTWTPSAGPPVIPAVSDQLSGLEDGRKEGSIFVTPAGGFAVVSSGVPIPYEVTPRKDRAELRTLLGIRDSMTSLLQLEASSADDQVCEPIRQQLNDRYDRYLRSYGPLNRFTQVRTGRQDPETGEDKYRQKRPTMGRFKDDPDFRSVMALEIFDPEQQTATKAAIFDSRVVAPREPRRGAESAQDALAICLDDHARVDLRVIADLLGTDVTGARAQLGGLVWDNPENGEVETAQRYLSGNVRSKLAEAEAAAGEDARWLPNVQALRAVMPQDLAPEEIDARLGSPWIPADDVRAFAGEVLQARYLQVEYAAVTATWTVKAGISDRQSVAMTSDWGTYRADAAAIMEASLNQRPATVYDNFSDGTRVLNNEETVAARAKQEALGERFASWVWENPQRAERLAADYNRRFNSTVLPAYDGSHLTLPGLASTFKPHPHQRDAVWRILSEPNTLLAHDVGAGKTAVMSIAAVEMRRLGLVNKPCIVVPNHMLDQFSREMSQLYPLAKVLVAEKEDTTVDGRKGFAAKCATGDWDAIVMTQSTFGRLPVSRETRRAYVEAELVELREAIADSKQGNALSVKRLEARVANREELLKRYMDESRKDDGVTFEMTGIDYCLVDEAHLYKNKSFVTHMQGVGGKGSNRAQDLELKLNYLRERHGERVATFATATPIANSISEMHVMQSYLQPQELARAGVERFDAWAATFGRSVTELELAPDGGSYRLNTRFARFANVPDLLRMFRAVADVRSAVDLSLKIPEIEGGKPETVVVPKSDQLALYVEGLVERAEAVRSKGVTPEEDNMLKIVGDGRKAALDLRLVHQPPDPEGGKLAAAAERIARLYHRRKDWTYNDAAGNPSPRPGSLQVVFCDISTPKPDAWNAYDHLRNHLVARGVPEHQIRYIHEAKDDRSKAELFAACRDGRVAVLFGSTEKMGVGTNVQARMSAIHHLDCPWRPADLSQRDGRGLRQGNQNDQIGIYRYVTEGSFDVYNWQTVERKATFIHQVMAGTVDGREVEDIGDAALSYAEVKALASGNPLIREKAGVDNDVARLSRLKQAHHQDQGSLKRRLNDTRSTIVRHEALIAQVDEALPRRVDTAGNKFKMRVEGIAFSKRPDAGERLLKTVKASLHQARTGTTPPERIVGELGGFPISMRTQREWVTLAVEGTPVQVGISADKVPDSDGLGTVIRLENQIRSLEEVKATSREELQRLRREEGAASDRIGRPFDQDSRLQSLLQRQAEINLALAPQEPAPADGTDTAGIKPPGTPAPAKGVPPSKQADPFSIRDSLAATAKSHPGPPPEAATHLSFNKPKQSR